MELFNLGKVPWEESQLLYHALAYLGRESLCLVSPSSPYVCIGFHQDVQQEVDIDFCSRNNIPVFRREVGGGSVFLDGNQLFFQLILKDTNPVVVKKIDAFYEKFLQPVINVHHQIGIPAQYKPVNDLVVEHRKISGTGAGEIGECIVFVGNLILDFDYSTMARVLRIPDEKFRDKVKKTIEENLTTISRELGHQRSAQWDENKLNVMMAEEFSKLTGPMTVAEIGNKLKEKMDALRKKMMHESWLFRRGKKVTDRIVKVKSGLEIVQKAHKALGGLMRAEFFIDEGRLRAVSISGDYFCFPSDTTSRLEKLIEGSSIAKLKDIVTDFYRSEDFEMPGIAPYDWIQLFKV
jgi:lipoate-protein ligase A